jgi:hypothetical protein
MKPKSIPPFPPAKKNPPGSPASSAALPKNFPESVPLTDDGIEAGKRESASRMSAHPAERPFAEEE